MLGVYGDNGDYKYCSVNFKFSSCQKTVYNLLIRERFVACNQTDLANIRLRNLKAPVYN